MQLLLSISATTSIASKGDVDVGGRGRFASVEETILLFLMMRASTICIPKLGIQLSPCHLCKSMVRLAKAHHRKALPPLWLQPP